MPKLILAVAGLIIVTASLLAVGAPTALVTRYERWSKLTSYIALFGLAWIALDAVGSVRTINQIVQDQGLTQESALHTVRMFAAEAVNAQRAYLPALSALLVAAAYTALLGKSRARRLRGNAA